MQKIFKTIVTMLFINAAAINAGYTAMIVEMQSPCQTQSPYMVNVLGIACNKDVAVALSKHITVQRTGYLQNETARVEHLFSGTKMLFDIARIGALIEALHYAAAVPQQETTLSTSHHTTMNFQYGFDVSTTRTLGAMDPLRYYVRYAAQHNTQLTHAIVMAYCNTPLQCVQKIHTMYMRPMQTMHRKTTRIKIPADEDAAASLITGYNGM